jgi:hypothetical protein
MQLGMIDLGRTGGAPRRRRRAGDEAGGGRWRDPRTLRPASTLRLAKVTIPRLCTKLACVYDVQLLGCQ